MHGQRRCKTVRNGREKGLATVKVLPYYTIPAGDCLRYLLYEPPRGKHNTTSSPLVLLKSILINIYILCKKNRNGYFPHRWGILLFTPPPGSRARTLGWSQYMHECVGASQGYHGVVSGLGLGLAVGWLVGSWRWGKYGFCPTGVGIPLYPWQHLDRIVWAAR